MFVLVTALTELAYKVSTNYSSSSVLWIQLIKTKTHNRFIVDLSNKYLYTAVGESVNVGSDTCVVMVTGDDK